MFFMFVHDFYRQETTHQFTEGQTTGHELWLPLPLAEQFIKAKIINEGDYFINTWGDKGAELWQVREGKTVNTGHVWRPDEGAFVKDLGEWDGSA